MYLWSRAFTDARPVGRNDMSSAAVNISVVQQTRVARSYHSNETA